MAQKQFKVIKEMVNTDTLPKMTSRNIVDAITGFVTEGYDMPIVVVQGKQTDEGTTDFSAILKQVPTLIILATDDGKVVDVGVFTGK